jgi:hypothetical protein
MNKRKLQIIGIFLKSKHHNSVKNSSITPKPKLHQDILMMNLYTKFHYSMCNLSEENELQLLMDRLTDKQQSNMPSLL